MWWIIGAAVTAYVVLFFWLVSRREYTLLDKSRWVIGFFFPLIIILCIAALIFIFLVWAAAEIFCFVFNLERKRDYHPDPFY